MIRKIALFIFFILLMLVLFALYHKNQTPVAFNFYGGVNVEVSIAIIIAIAFLVGLIVGTISAYPKRMKLKQIIRQKDKQIKVFKESMIKSDI